MTNGDQLFYMYFLGRHVYTTGSPHGDEVKNLERIVIVRELKTFVVSVKAVSESEPYCNHGIEMLNHSVQYYVTLTDEMFSLKVDVPLSRFVNDPIFKVYVYSNQSL